MAISRSRIDDMNFEEEAILIFLKIKFYHADLCFGQQFTTAS